MRASFRNILIAGFLCGCAALPFLNILHNDFVEGDFQFILDNPKLRNLDNIFYGFKTNFWAAQDEDSSSYYRPLTTVVYFVDFHFFGRRPFGYHLVNILYLCLIVLFLYGWVFFLTRDAWAGIVTALLFASHPLHCHLVTYIAGIGDLQGALFYFIALLSYIGFRTSTTRTSIRWLAMCVITFTLSIFTKEIAITFPAIMLLYDGCAHTKNSMKMGRKDLLSYGLIGFSIAGYLLARRAAIGTFVSLQASSAAMPLFSHALTVIASFGLYLIEFIYPLKLSFIVPMFAATSFFEAKVLAGMTYFAVGVLILILVRKNILSRWFLFAHLFYGIALLPLSNIVPISYYAKDHFSFIPTAGLCLLIALSLASLRDLWRGKSWILSRTPLLAAFLLVLYFSIVTWRRNRVWAQEITLLEDAIAKMPVIEPHHMKDPWDNRTVFQYALAYNTLGVDYLHAGNTQRAADTLMKGHLLAPDYLDLDNNLGLVYMQVRRWREAEEIYKNILQVNPAYYHAWNNLGSIYISMKRYPESIRCSEKALEYNPNNFHALTNLGNASYYLGHFESALRYYEACVRLYPDIPKGWKNLAIAHSALGHAGQAQEAFDRSKSLPNIPSD
jgi:protein O-mannosyl-transferase